MNCMISNKILTIFLLLIICYVIYKQYYCDSSSEHLTIGSSSLLSNEAVQNMSSMLNTGTGTMQNLVITGKLQLGNVVLTPNTDGSVKFGNSTLYSDGTILNPVFKWKTTGAQWQMTPEGDYFVIRNIGATSDRRFALGTNVTSTF